MTRVRFGSPFLWALLSAALIGLATRPWGLPHLAWAAFVPLMLVLPASRSWWLAGVLAGVAALGITLAAYEAAAALGGGWHLFALLLGTLPFALAGAGAWAVARRLPPVLAPYVLALFWAVAEFVPAQPALLGRFALPLSTIGYTQAGHAVMHLARFGSVSATSLALLLANAAASQLLTLSASAASGRRLRAAAAPAMTLLTLAALVLGAWLSAPEPTATKFDVAVVQPHRPNAVLAAATQVAAVRDHVVEQLAALAAALALASPTSEPGAAASSKAPQLVVFPEAAWPQAISVAEPMASLPQRSLGVLNSLPSSLLGSAGHTPQGNTNSAFLWARGELVHAYAKLHLVPVGEAGLVAGSAPVPVTVPGGQGAVLSVAPFICYDVAFAGTVRRAVLAGAQLLAVLTNDAFAARGDVPHQHLRLARFRAVESGVPLAFASNTGPSALVRSNGQLAAVSVAGQPAVLRAELGAGAGPTPYVRYGDWVGALMCFTAVLLAAVATMRAAGKRGGEPSALT